MHWLWVTHFPMFERSENKWKAAHLPFTSPSVEWQQPLMNQDSKCFENAVSRSYDLVVNGTELGGGSVRIHDYALQVAVLNMIGVKDTHSMSHLLNALQLGTPPHAGIALGLDRLMMQLLDTSDIRNVIAFPKAADGKEYMVDSPARIK